MRAISGRRAEGEGRGEKGEGSRGVKEKNIIKIKKGSIRGTFFSCEGRVRTSDLRVMSPTSYRCSTSRCGEQIYAVLPWQPNLYTPLDYKYLLSGIKMEL